MVVQEGELKHWKQLGINYMTEESDDPSDPNVIVIHPLPWRSESEIFITSVGDWYLVVFNYCVLVLAGLNGFLSKLDRRYEHKVKKDGNTMAKKVRKIGTASDSPPPSGAPDWALNETWISKL